MSEESSNEEKANTETPAESQAPAAPEDPEIVAIKEEIAKLESTLKEKRRELDYAVDKADEYTKSGYARKVAEMENMRRARSVSRSRCVVPWTWSITASHRRTIPIYHLLT